MARIGGARKDGKTGRLQLCGLDPRDYLLAATQTAQLDGGVLIAR